MAKYFHYNTGTFVNKLNWVTKYNNNEYCIKIFLKQKLTEDIMRKINVKMVLVSLAMVAEEDDDDDGDGNNDDSSSCFFLLLGIFRFSISYD